MAMVPSVQRIESGRQQNRMSSNTAQAEEAAHKAHLQEEMRDLLFVWEKEHENSDWDVYPTLKRFVAPSPGGGTRLNPHLLVGTRKKWKIN